MKNILKVEGKISILALIVSIAIPLAGSSLISFFTMSKTGEGYENIIKPPFAPPNWAFGVVWPILYILMGLSAYRIYMKMREGVRTNALFFYGVQLILNFLWPIIYFNFKLYGLAFVELIVLIIFIIITIVKFYKVDRIAGMLLVPYLLWSIFAAVLNFYIWYLNEA